MIDISWELQTTIEPACFFCCRGTVDGRIAQASWYGEYPNVYGGFIDISSGLPHVWTINIH